MKWRYEIYIKSNIKYDNIYFKTEKIIPKWKA